MGRTANLVLTRLTPNRSFHQQPWLPSIMKDEVHFGLEWCFLQGLHVTLLCPSKEGGSCFPEKTIHISCCFPDLYRAFTVVMPKKLMSSKRDISAFRRWPIEESISQHMLNLLVVSRKVFEFLLFASLNGPLRNS